MENNNVEQRERRPRSSARKAGRVCGMVGIGLVALLDLTLRWRGKKSRWPGKLLSFDMTVLEAALTGLPARLDI